MPSYKIEFSKLLNTHEYCIVTKLEALNWMLKTSKDTFRIWKWNSASVEKQIFGYSGAASYALTPPIDIFDNDKLRIYFLNAILCDCHPVVKEWREREKVALGSYRYIPFVKEDGYVSRFSNLKNLTGLNLRKKFYQPDHPDRQHPFVKNHNFCSRGNGLEFHYDFTFQGLEDSGWAAPSLIQAIDESIISFLNRIEQHFRVHAGIVES